MDLKFFELRQFQESDYDAVYHLHIAGLQQSESFISDPVARKLLDKDFKNIREEYINNKGEFLVAVIHDQIIGIGGLRKIDSITAEIKRMRVDEKFRGQGVGKSLLDQLIQRAKEVGYQQLVLDTSFKQTAAQNLYISRGFKETGRGEIYGQKTIYYRLFL